MQEALANNGKMKSLLKNKSRELVNNPLRKKLVGCRRIFTLKYKAYSTNEPFKARLGAKGQTYGINYTKTFALVAKMNTVRALLSLGANLDWPLQ